MTLFVDVPREIWSRSGRSEGLRVDLDLDSGLRVSGGDRPAVEDFVRVVVLVVGVSERSVGSVNRRCRMRSSSICFLL